MWNAAREREGDVEWYDGGKGRGEFIILSDLSCYVPSVTIITSSAIQLCCRNLGNSRVQRLFWCHLYKRFIVFFIYIYLFDPFSDLMRKSLWYCAENTVRSKSQVSFTAFSRLPIRGANYSLDYWMCALSAGCVWTLMTHPRRVFAEITIAPWLPKHFLFCICNKSCFFLFSCIVDKPSAVCIAATYRSRVCIDRFTASCCATVPALLTSSDGAFSELSSGISNLNNILKCVAQFSNLVACACVITEN